MVKERQIVDVIAPCGLDCGQCLAFEGGQIQGHAQALIDLLGPNFGEYAARFEAMNQVFGNYPAFKELLRFLAGGTCQGCRKGGCLFEACGVRTCVKEKGVDFCFECPEFPCQKLSSMTRLETIWRRNNEKMKELGIEKYYEMIKNRPRYP